MLRLGQFLIAINATGFGDECTFSCSSPLFLLTERLTGGRLVALICIPVANSDITDSRVGHAEWRQGPPTLPFSRCFRASPGAIVVWGGRCHDQGPDWVINLAESRSSTNSVV